MRTLEHALDTPTDTRQEVRMHHLGNQHDILAHGKAVGECVKILKHAGLNGNTLLRTHDLKFMSCTSDMLTVILCKRPLRSAYTEY